MKKLFLLSIILGFSNFNFYADGENQTPRYLSPNGQDMGNCANRAMPCASVSYVITKAAKADPVYMAGGEYSIKAQEVVHFTGDKVPLLPGYSRRDLYNTKSLQLNPVTLIGVPFYFSNEIEAKGFRVISDRKGITASEKLAAEKFTESFVQTSRKNNTASECIAGMAGNFPCWNIDLQAQLSLNNMSSSPNSGSDIWGHVDLNNNREYALMGLNNGTIVVDVTDPENPSEVGTINGVSSTWRDIKVYQYLDNGSYKAYAYVTTEGTQGLQVINLNNLPNSISLAATINSDFRTAHNIYISNVDYSNNTVLSGMSPYIYIAGAGNGSTRLNSGAFRIFDLSTPVSPSLIAQPPAGTGYVHDATSLIVDDSRTAQCAAGHNPCELFVDFNESTVDLWDMTDKNSPVQISSTPYSGSAYTHSGWYSADKNFIYIQDELDEQNNSLNTTVRVLDISNLSAPSIVSTYTGPTRAIDHNGFTLGDKYYMSNYRRGLTILDLSNPAAPSEFGHFDTFPTPATNSPTFDGAWGVYPYLPSGNILVSDINNGLFILKESTSPQAQPGNLGFSGTGQTVNENVGSISITISRTDGDAGEISIDYSTINGTAVSGSDFESAAGTLTWTDGDTADKTISVTILDDTLEENLETFRVELSNPSNGANSGTTSYGIRISANDAPVTTTPPPVQSSGGGGGSLGFGMILLMLLTLRFRRKNI